MASVPVEEIPAIEHTNSTAVEEPNQIDTSDKEVTIVLPTYDTYTRKQLYDKIWTISAAKAAREFNIPYALFIRQVKKAAIPIPPSGYWTKLEFGKPVEKTELTGDFDAIVHFELSSAGIVPSEQSTQDEDNIQETPLIIPVIEDGGDSTLPDEDIPALADVTPIGFEENGDSKSYGKVVPIPADVTHTDMGDPDTVQKYGQTFNVYDRDTLYKEVWAVPVTEVAKKYKVSDVAIHKVCKALDVPIPPRGYWAKYRTGKPVKTTPLPERNTITQKTGLQTGAKNASITSLDKANCLQFLEEDDRIAVLAVASQIAIPGKQERMDSKIIANRKKVAEWRKLYKERADWNPQVRKRNMPPAPLLAENIAEESVPRASHIIDALIKNMEPLGCALTDALQFIINGETVTLSFSESMDKVAHVPTKAEKQQLVEYELKQKQHKYAYKPNIRKYDSIYNGTLSLSVQGQKTYRDCKSYRLEDRLGDIMLDMYTQAEALKQDRLAREEQERIRKEKEQRKREWERRYDEEVDRTLALANMADDYDIACKIRKYVKAYSDSHPGEDILQFQSWALAKADWYDPTIAAEDEFFGKRKHEESEEDKKLKKHSRYWW